MDRTLLWSRRKPPSFLMAISCAPQKFEPSLGSLLLLPRCALEILTFFRLQEAIHAKSHNHLQREPSQNFRVTRLRGPKGAVAVVVFRTWPAGEVSKCFAAGAQPEIGAEVRPNIEFCSHHPLLSFNFRIQNRGGFRIHWLTGSSVLYDPCSERATNRISNNVPISELLYPRSR